MKFDITTATAKGPRPYQEDRFAVHYVLDGYLLAIMDGHGGAYVAEFVSNNLSQVWANAGEHWSLEHPETEFTVELKIKETFRTLNEATKDISDGSTLSLAWLPDNEAKVYVAVLGDSPVIVKDAVGVVHHSVEHNVRTNLMEEQAVLAKGGFVANGYAFANRYGDGLQMSRALGDAALDTILNREPEITSFDLGPESFVLVGSDGCFDPGHSSTAGLDAVVDILNAGGDAQKIVDNALAQKIYDNSTAVLARVVAD